jgi:hypothetical protein
VQLQRSLPALSSLRSEGSGAEPALLLSRHRTHLVVDDEQVTNYKIVRVVEASPAIHTREASATDDRQRALLRSCVRARLAAAGRSTRCRTAACSASATSAGSACAGRSRVAKEAWRAVLHPPSFSAHAHAAAASASHSSAAQAPCSTYTSCLAHGLRTNAARLSSELRGARHGRASAPAHTGRPSHHRIAPHKARAM